LWEISGELSTQHEDVAAQVHLFNLPANYIHPVKHIHHIHIPLIAYVIARYYKKQNFSKK